MLASLPTASYPSQAKFQPWETCMTMNQTWAYNATDKTYKSAARLIASLVETASRGGNYLLNVGPSPEGTFPPEAVDRLRAIGRWMAVNGESIQGTTYGPLQHLLLGRTTAKERTIYLHVWEWPSSAQISLGAMPGAVSEVRLLAGDELLPFHHAGNDFTIEVPGQAPDPIVTVLAIALKPPPNRSAL
jgi:alpha-L-fucosidase